MNITVAFEYCHTDPRKTRVESNQWGLDASFGNWLVQGTQRAGVVLGETYGKRSYQRVEVTRGPLGWATLLGLYRLQTD